MRNPIDFRRNVCTSELIDLNEFKTGPVILTQEEIDAAFKNGKDRLDDVKKRGRQNTHGGSYSYGNHQIGSCGEIAFAKIQEAIWPDSINTFHEEPDVGGMEVRATKETGHRLLVREDDQDLSFGLVVPIRFPEEHWCVGWMHKRDIIKHPEWYENPNAKNEWCWLVPQRFLVRSRMPNALEMEAFRKEHAAWEAV